MAAYTVRVELHHADALDYERLHDLMALKGYKRTLIGDAGREDHLPTAMYDLSSSTLSFIQVCDQVAAIADTIKPGAWVFVDEVIRRAWRTAPTAPANALAALSALDRGHGNAWVLSLSSTNALASLTPWDRRYGAPGNALSALAGLP
jgi:hypothetical protein